MAGTIVADTLTHSTAGSITTNYVVDGSAKAWGYFIYTSGAPDSQDSLNVSSYDDDGTGQAGINFVSSMNNNDFCTVAIQENQGAPITNNPSGGRTTSSTNVRGRNTTFSDVDTEQNWLVMGDLA